MGHKCLGMSHPTPTAFHISRGPTVMPSRHLPSEPLRPDGSSCAGIYNYYIAEVSTLCMMSFMIITLLLYIII